MHDLSSIAYLLSTDEAHNIKNEKTNRAVACCALEAKFRWCLTGTPMYGFTLAFPTPLLTKDLP